MNDYRKKPKQQPVKKKISPEEQAGILARDERYMRHALELAKKAAELGEVPVGAVVVRGDKVISEAYNLRETGKNALAHAELMAMDKACAALGRWRLDGCELYVTLEPCPMCAGAIINSRISRVVFAAKDARAGALGSLINLDRYPFNHHPEIVSGVLGAEAAGLLRDFFGKLREKRK